MVDKRKRIARKPQSRPEAEQWVASGGIDPEIEALSPPPGNKSGDSDDKPYPHRISLDLTSAQYKRLKYASFDSAQSQNALLREALDAWLKSRDY